MTSDAPTQQHNPRSHGWFKAQRNPEAFELIRACPNAFVLLYVIAFRARWRHGFNQHQLAAGQAFLGDFESYGMTERGYRTAKSFLAKHGFATFTATNKGTVATIASTSVFDVFSLARDGQADRQATSKRRTSDGQATTNEEGKKVKTEKNSTPPLPPHLVPSVASSPARNGGGRTSAKPHKDFPGTEDEAIARAEAAGVPRDFAFRIWNECMARGGVDHTGQTITSWRLYARARWTGERARLEERKSLRHRPSRTSRPDHEKGF
ncbi:MAG TPA: hypothetical protein PKM73_18855 [Verrucomicrobiota bacterium]|nr:hypothetical protein [Verrucomicrobiota bacterium]HNU52951.1 hypothetical protein [Verrucomicrobiota bacterium]